MSFFNKIFGENSKKTTKVPSKSAEEIQKQKELRIEASINTLQMKIRDFQDKEKKLEHKIDLQKSKAKELLTNGKKKDAKKLIEEATRIQKQMESITLRRKALQNKKDQLEIALLNIQTLNPMQDAQKHLKDLEKQNQKLDDFIIEEQQIKITQEQMNQKIKNFVQNSSDCEEVDDMLNELMGEIIQEKKDKIKHINSPNAHIPQKQTNKNKQQDEIAKMLADLES